MWQLTPVYPIFCHENEDEKNYPNPQFARIRNTVDLIQESNRVINKNRENLFFHVFLLFLTGTPLHFLSDITRFVILFWKVYSLSNKSAATPMGIRLHATPRVMVPARPLRS